VSEPHPQYRLKYWFEWGGGCLWAADRATGEDFGYCCDLAALGLSADLRRRIGEMEKWHDTALNWIHPPDPGPWRREECDRWNRAAAELYRSISLELGDRFQILNEEEIHQEDPGLDAYLKALEHTQMKGDR
jgi:hypothetical protein